MTQVSASKVRRVLGVRISAISLSTLHMPRMLIRVQWLCEGTDGCSNSDDLLRYV